MAHDLSSLSEGARQIPRGHYHLIQIHRAYHFFFRRQEGVRNEYYYSMLRAD